MPASKHILFSEDSYKGRKFSEIYMNATGNGINLHLAKKFSISVCTVQRIRKKLGLPSVHSPNHPGKTKFYMQIKRLYTKKGLSTLRIADKYNKSSQQINKILKSMNVKLRPQHVIDSKYFKTRSNLNPEILLKKIKKLYITKGYTVKAIAKELGIDQGTVSSKLKSMNIQVKKERREGVCIYPNYNIKAIYSDNADHYIVNEITAPVKIKPKSYNTDNCLWCGNKMELYIATGPKKQKFCSTRCKNLAKDLRRGPTRSIKRFEHLAKLFYETWKSQSYDKLQDMGIKPRIKAEVFEV